MDAKKEYMVSTVIEVVVFLFYLKKNCIHVYLKGPSKSYLS